MLISNQKESKKESKKDKNLSKNEKEVEVRAALNYLRVSPRKVRAVANLIKGQRAVVALNTLIFINKAAARPITKLLNSAIANAENNFKLDKNDLYIKNIIVNSGATLKRWQPRAYGRAASIKKRTSRINIILSLKKRIKKPIIKTKTSEKEKKEMIKTLTPQEIKKEARKEEEKLVKLPERVTETKKGFVKKIFSRKAGM